jgi:hypothetical protein
MVIRHYREVQLDQQEVTIQPVPLQKVDLVAVVVELEDLVEVLVPAVSVDPQLNQDNLNQHQQLTTLVILDLDLVGLKMVEEELVVVVQQQQGTMLVALDKLSVLLDPP